MESQVSRIGADQLLRAFAVCKNRLSSFSFSQVGEWASANANSVKTTAVSRKKEQSSVVKVDLGGTWLIGHQKGHT